MKVALVQAPLHWENPIQNRNYFEDKINSITEKIDLIVLPEMFTSGFTMNPKAVAETMQGETVLWLQVVSKAKNAAITGSLVIEENGNFYNRLVFVFPTGEIKTYDKKHLFTLAGEDKAYTSGTEKLVFEYQGFRICPLICYDLRFPVFARNTEDYDVLIYVANWPKPRINAWDALLKARTIENMCYIIGVNRMGEDPNQHHYPGHSQVIDYLGNFLVEPQYNEGVFITTLNKNTLEATRQKLGFLNDRDAFTI
jgi:omega-amidase